MITFSDAVIRDKLRDEVYQNQLTRLEELSTLKANWDDDGAQPIEPKTIKNVRRLIEMSDDEDLKKWIIFPDINGTILLESKTGDATISVGNSDFSYSSKNIKGSNKRMTPSTF